MNVDAWSYPFHLFSFPNSIKRTESPSSTTSPYKESAKVITVSLPNKENNSEKQVWEDLGDGVEVLVSRSARSSGDSSCSEERRKRLLKPNSPIEVHAKRNKPAVEPIILSLGDMEIGASDRSLGDQCVVETPEDRGSPGIGVKEERSFAATGTGLCRGKSLGSIDKATGMVFSVQDIANVCKDESRDVGSNVLARKCSKDEMLGSSSWQDVESTCASTANHRTSVDDKLVYARQTDESVDFCIRAHDGDNVKEGDERDLLVDTDDDDDEDTNSSIMESRTERKVAAAVSSRFTRSRVLVKATEELEEEDALKEEIARQRLERMQFATIPPCQPSVPPVPGNIHDNRIYSPQDSEGSDGTRDSLEVFMNLCKRQIPLVISSATSSSSCPLGLVTMDVDVEFLILDCYYRCDNIFHGKQMFSQALRGVMYVWNLEQQEYMYHMFSQLCKKKEEGEIEQRIELFRRLRDSEELDGVPYKHIHSFWYTNLVPARVIQQGIGKASYGVKDSRYMSRFKELFESDQFCQNVGRFKSFLLCGDPILHESAAVLGRVNVCLNLYMQYVLNPYEFVVRMIAVWKVFGALGRSCRELWMRCMCRLLPSSLQEKVLQFLLGMEMV